MKPTRIFLILLLFTLTLFAVPCFGMDTDLYISKGSGVPPNILIIFDNSGSMAENIPGPTYDPNHEYDPLEVDTAYKNKVYNCTSSGCNKYISSTNWLDYSSVSCNTARTALGTLGYWQGRLRSTSACGNYSYPSYTLRTGNYRNYLKWIATDPMYSRRKIDIARDIIKEFIDQVEGVRVGIMIFYSSEGGHILVGPSPDYYRCDILDLIVRDGATQAQLDADTAIRNKMKAALDSLNPGSYTPLAETLYEAGLYYRGHQSYFEYTGSSPKVYRQYVSPVQYSCQSNNVIIITDGDSTQDRNDLLRYGATVGTVTYPAIGDQDGDKWEPGYSNEKHYYDCSNCDPPCTYGTGSCVPNDNCCNDMSGSDYLDDVAKYLYEAKDSSVSINTNTIGFAVKSQNDLLGRAAAWGNGKYFYSETGQDLAKNFQSVIGNILAVTTSYVAPIVPVSQYEKTTAGDKIYLALFKPIQNDIWVGNIKKFGVAQPVGTTSDCINTGSFTVGEVLDADCRRALDDDGKFYSAAKSYWTNILDGGEAALGGVGGVLKNRDFSSDPRKIYTYLGSNVDLTNAANKFDASNTSITAATLGVLTEDERKSVINFVHGYDYSATVSDKRDWILGGIIHSRPVVVRYPDYSDRTLIFVGSNDGMLHAFDDSDGSELWAFIPPTLLNRLSALRLGGAQWFVDGSPKVYLGTDKKILVFGLRRGGDILTKSNCYVALNITNPTSPQFLWMITPDKIVKGTVSTPSTDYSELGQTWSNPQLGKIDDGTTSGQWVMFVGGGYDNYNQDKENPYTDVADSYGRAVYIVNILDGSLVKRFSFAEDSTMTYSIPSDISKVDVNGDGKIDRLYVGDMAGRVWRFDITGANKTYWTGKIVFRSNPSTAVTNLRKMFYPPDVTLENDAYAGDYEMLFFGTGDREHPSDKTIVNRLYGVKVKNPSIIYTEDDLYDATDNILQDGNDTDKDAALVQLKAKSGWFIRFEPDTEGEKSLATPVVFYRTAYFTTFTPSPDAPPTGTDPCYVGEGTAKLYALAYFTGAAALNLDLTNDTSGTTISKSDRSEVIGTSIPSGVIITFVWGKGVAYTGVGGGIRSTKLPTDKSIVPIYWRNAF